jgi:uncharacterized membrane protein
MYSALLITFTIAVILTSDVMPPSVVSIVSLNTISLYLMFFSDLIKRSLKRRKTKRKIMK